jgi:uncharacterized protein with PIN domain
MVRYNICIMVYFAAAVALSVLIWLLSVLYRLNLSRSLKNDAESRLKTQKNESGKVEFVRCPMCNTPLAKGEELTSRIFRPMDTPDQRMNVMGCPHCYPHPERGAERRCPVCGREVLPEGYLIARLFNRSDTKKHVMIMGCTNCMKG